MGVDVHVPRVSRDRNVAPAARTSAHKTSVVLVLARGGAGHPLLAQVLRALRFAGIAGRVEASADAARIADAAGLVVFGDTLARETGTLLPANRRGNPHWFAAPDPASVSTDAAAKRALWSELKALVRRLRAGAG
ncbi:MAG TPA: hypothetical protein VH375_04485 [Rhodanobacteraceae bacterium]